MVLHQTSILGGKYKGAKLFVSPSLRSATSRTRKAIIDILKHKILKANVLDLYAGAGTVGLELASHGANRITFVEKNPRHCLALKQNCEKLSEKNYIIHPLSVENFIKTNSQKFDIVFAGAPYKEVPRLPLKKIFHHLLDKNGILIVEWSKRYPPPSLEEAKQKTYRYGDTNLTFYYA